jgi:CRISPR system Cascade subunit CasE
MHAAIESAFAPEASGENSRSLWRLEAGRDDLKLYLLSERIPSLEHLQEQAGWANEETWESRPYDTMLSRLQIGQQYGFRLTANPVHTVTNEQGIKRKLAHVTVAQQAKWLADRGESIGVRFLSSVDGSSAEPAGSHKAEAQEVEVSSVIADAVLVSQRETLRFRRGDQHVTLARAQFDGKLEVTDATRLRDALTKGVGRAKAYGCGLLTLAPIGRS